MNFQITHKTTGAVLFELECENLKLCVQEAVKTGADLSDAKLNRANLSDANLIEANLSGANLNRANLIDAKLSGVTY